MRFYYFFLFIVFILFSFISKEKITKVQYDYIIGYNYNIEDSILPKRPRLLREQSLVKNGEVQFPFVQNQKKLTTTQALELIQITNAPTTYSKGAAACFEPRLTYVLYKENKISGYIDICFECDRLESPLLIPAIYKIEKKRTAAGFSETGRSNLKKLTDDIGLYSY